MSERPVLVYLHGVGDGDVRGAWRETLETSLARLGYPGLDGVTTVAPRYAHALRGADDRVPIPEERVELLSRKSDDFRRWEFNLRVAALESALGGFNKGNENLAAGIVVGTALDVDILGFAPFKQAKNYLQEEVIRANVLSKILKEIPNEGRIVLVGHSLGSVIAADVLRRLSPDVEVAGMVTIGSPIAHADFKVKDLVNALGAPPENLAWWANFWNSADPVPGYRGASHVFPWVTDVRLQGVPRPEVHKAATYLQNDAVAGAIGYALFGSLSKELGAFERGLVERLDDYQTMAVLALRYAHIVKSNLRGELERRYSEALRRSQATAIDELKQFADNQGKRLPVEIASLAVDLSEPDSVPPAPRPVHHLSAEEAIVPLIAVGLNNSIAPYEIKVSDKVQEDSLVELTIEMGLGRELAVALVEAIDDAEEALVGRRGNWVKVALLGVGAVAILATGGLALVAAPAGLAGGAAIVAGLAAFGPGGMIGGLLTAGALISVGSGSIAASLVSPGASAEQVEGAVTTLLTQALLRDSLGYDQVLDSWDVFTRTESEIHRNLGLLAGVSDKSAPSVKLLQKKLKTVVRALDCLEKKGLRPIAGELTTWPADA